MVQSLGPAGEQLKLPFISAKGRQMLSFQILLPSFFFFLFPCIYLLLVLKTKLAPLFSVPMGEATERGAMCLCQAGKLGPWEGMRREARACVHACTGVLT